jgi:predicted amidohydrolase
LYNKTKKARTVVMKKIKISVVQFSLNPIKSFTEFEEQVVMGTEQAKDSDFIVFPELMTLRLMSTFPGYEEFTISDLIKTTEFTDQYVDLFKRLAREKGQYIVAGSHMIKEGVNYYNTSHLFGPDGTLVRHRKTHLFPIESAILSEGNTIEVLELPKVKIGIAICYEAEIPEYMRILTLKGAEIVFCPSFTLTEAGFWRVRHCCQAGCIENQIYMVHCSSVGEVGIPGFTTWGMSSILSPCDNPWPANGVVAQAEANKEMVITAEVDIDELYVNREKGAATTFKDRARRADLYEWLYRRPR